MQTQAEFLPAANSDADFNENSDDEDYDADDIEGSGSGDFQLIVSPSTSPPSVDFRWWRQQRKRKRIGTNHGRSHPKRKYNYNTSVKPSATKGITNDSGGGGHVQRFGFNEQPMNVAWQADTRAMRIMGNVRISEERSRQLLFCEEAGGGELCRMLFKGHLASVEPSTTSVSE